MESGDAQNLSLGEAASRFLASLPPEERVTSQPETYRFIRWYGQGRPLDGLTAPEVANYAERLSSSDTDYARRLELIRAFLVYAHKEGWSKKNLATHLKARKEKVKSTSPSRRGAPKAVSLTQEGYAELAAELETLKNKRHEAIDEIRRAAADKDFRENAPLDAAREQRGQLEGRILELEEVLKSALIVDSKQEIISKMKVTIGDGIILANLASGEEHRYILVSPREVDVARGKISSASPLGRAIIGKGQGETVEVEAPAGKLRYQIKQVYRS